MVFFSNSDEFSHTLEVGDKSIFVMASGVVGIVLRRSLFDCEAPDYQLQRSEIAKVLSSLPSNVLARFTLATSVVSLQKPVRTTELLLSIEGDCRGALNRNISSTQSVSKWLAEIPILRLLDLGFSPLNDSDTRELFRPCTVRPIRSGHTVIDGGRPKAVLRLIKQKEGEIDSDTLVAAIHKVGGTLKVVATYAKLDELRAQQVLRQKESRKKGSADVVDVLGATAAQDAIRETFAGEKQLVQIEWLLVLEEETQSDLEKSIPRVRGALSELGDVYVETVGALPSYRASLVGSRPHFRFLEVSDAALSFLPFAGYPARLSTGKTAFFKAARVDDSAFALDFFDPAYGGCNILINGLRGGGKSVTANIISKALLADSRVQLIKFDVGGSYRKECELANGSIFDFRENAPSGINPMLLPEEGGENTDFIRTVSGFLSALVLETTEVSLPQHVSASMEAAVQRYYESKPRAPSLRHFVESAPEVPRVDLLRRWSHGLLKNIFSETPDAKTKLENRYVYFNLEHLSSAADSTYVRGVFGALIAFANIAMLKAGDARQQNRKRVVLFADEVPFVSKVYADYLKFTTANFRKFGHGTVLIAQSIDSLTIDRPGQPRDFAVVKQSPIRFLFDVEVPEERFKADCSLNEAEIAKIRSLYRGSEYREVLLQLPHSSCGTESLVLRIRLTPEELWEYTSSEAQNATLYALLGAVPGLTLGQAIQCLAVQGVRR